MVLKERCSVKVISRGYNESCLFVSYYNYYIALPCITTPCRINNMLISIKLEYNVYNHVFIDSEASISLVEFELFKKHHL